MAVLQGRTRAELRAMIAREVGGYVSSATAQGTTTTLADSSLAQGSANDNAQMGKFLDFTSGTNSGLVSQCTSSTVASNVTTYTFAPARTQTESADTYIAWPRWIPTSTINGLMDDAITRVTGRFFDHIEYIGLKGDSRTRRFDLPTTMTAVTEVYRRMSVESADIQLCDAVWTTDIDADVTASLDTEDYKQGGASMKFVVAAGAAAGDIIAAQEITAKDLSGYDYMEFWAKASAAVAAAGLKLHLHTAAIADGSTSTEVLSLPALTANAWQFCRVALANPRSDTAITYVGLELDADATITAWLDEIRAVHHDSAQWDDIPRDSWYLDKEGRDLVFEPGGFSLVGDRVLKLKGGDKPTLLTADTTVTEVPEDYIMAYVLTSVLSYAPEPVLARKWERWATELERARKSLPKLQGARLLE